MAREKKDAEVKNIPTERLHQHCMTILKMDPMIDYFILGHHHLPLDRKIGERTRFLLIGDWITHFSYVVFDGKEVMLKYFR